MSLAEYYANCPIPKGKPRVIAKLEKTRAADRVEEQCRKKVDARDGHRCFFPGCRVRSSDKHHIRPRSLQGEWLTGNILSSCRRHHDWFKAGLIRVQGNPDRGPVKVFLTKLGEEARVRIPQRAA